MELFWPCGIYVNESEEEKPLFTYDACLSIGEALKVINCWVFDYEYKISKAWIDVYNNNALLRKIQVLPCITIEGGRS